MKNLEKYLCEVIEQHGFEETIKTLQSLALEHSELWRNRKRKDKAIDYEKLYQSLETPLKKAIHHNL